MKKLIINIPDEDYEENLSDAAFFLNYKNVIFDDEAGKEILNPKSEEDTIVEYILWAFNALIESGNAKRAEATRTQLVEEAKVRTDKITVSITSEV